MGRGVQELGEVLSSLPNVSVTLEGSGFQIPALRAMLNVQVEPHRFDIEDSTSQDDSGSSSSSDDSDDARGLFGHVPAT